MGQLLTSLEYENLVTALNLALAAQVSIYNLYFALVRLPGCHSGSASWTGIRSDCAEIALEAYPPDN